MTLVEPVSFKKPRAAAPRLSAPYVPGRRSERFWRDDEIALLRADYPSKGASYCASLLPGRSVEHCYAKANALGLKREGSAIRRSPRVTLTDELAAKIRERWPGLAGKGAISTFARELGIRRDTLSSYALKLNLTIAHKKEPPWKPAEEELLRRVVGKHSLAVCAQIFREHGFARSEISLRIRAKRLEISTRWRGTLSAGAAARILGIDSHAISALCIEGRLKAEKRATNRLPQQGGDPWSIRREDFRQYVIDDIAHIDIRKVDRVSFVDLLVNHGPASEAAATPEPCRCRPARAIPKLRAMGYRIVRRRR